MVEQRPKGRPRRLVEQRPLEQAPADELPTGTTLVDVGGRRVAVTETGDPAGAPVFWFHATPGARFAAPAVRAAAAELGLRLVLTDRPGFGRSDLQRDRDLATWAADVAAVAGHLGIDEFAAAGSSGGGPHALAVAHHLGDRVTSVGLLGSLGPLPAGRLPETMKSGNRLLFGLARRRPWLFRIVNRLVTAPFIVTVNDDRWAETIVTRVMLRLSEAERTLVSTPEARADLIESLREATRQGSAALTEELLMLTRPWGFDLAVPATVHLWHGIDDASVPVSIARDFADAIPGCNAHWLDGGHAAWLLHLDEVLPPLRTD